jgi:hypothetical protein
MICFSRFKKAQHCLKETEYVLVEIERRRLKGVGDELTTELKKNRW